ncbi:MAG: hypothetical protein AB1714_30990 [Acidobacteriota bacterium]
MDTKKPVTKVELVNKLSDQVNKLSGLCELYDRGEYHYAQDMAVKIRLIFSNTNNQKSLLRLLKLEHISIVDTCRPYDPENLLTHLGLLSTRVDMPDKEITYVPSDNPSYNLVSIDNWWNRKKVIVDQNKESFTRKRLILETADRDGGAHVDASLDEKYYDLSRQNTAGWWIRSATGEKSPLNDPVPPSIRQIATEVIRTFSLIDISRESKLRS